MNTLRVSCWHFSDKDFTSWVSDSICVRFPTPLHDTNGFTQAPWTLTVPPVASVKPDSLLLGRVVCRNRLKRLRLSPIALCAEASKRVRTFGRSSARFRENYTRFWDKIQAHFTLKMGPRPSLTVEKSGHCIGAHFREKGCAFSGEVVRTFGRSECA